MRFGLVDIAVDVGVIGRSLHLKP